MSRSPIKVAVNPLPWVLTESGWSLTRRVLVEALTELRDVGFRAIHCEVPDELTVAEYRETLAEYGFQPAPGYFSARFDDREALPEILERARAAAETHTQLGLSQIFVASDMAPDRMVHPAVGHSPDGDRIGRVIDGLVAVADAMLAQGVVAALHPHVGTWVESEPEVRAVLDATDGSALAFGPDTGHLYWAGGDPVALVKEYAARVACLHIKDVDAAAAQSAAEHGDDYNTATFGRHVWTEPGRGDVDLDGVIAALPDTFDGWAVLEVDVPNLPTRVDSSRAGLDYLRSHPAFAVPVS
ncbi:MAG TPA: sugar phosphate isomerase/epimerase [Dermatophilaceae bacterium]|nr:sugar phosphate isomerase/epimerase [Dermatophilaceae bacterium]